MIPIPLPWKWGVGVVAIAAAAAYGTYVWQQRYLAGKKAGKAEVQALWDADKLRRSEQALKDVAELVALRRQEQEQADAAARKFQAQQARDRRIIADLRDTDERLRRAIEIYARGGSADLPTCLARAESIRQLLGKALRTSEECAAAGERDAGVARALQELRR